MEAPAANITEFKQFEYQYNNKKYIFNLSYNKNILINITCLDSKQTFINEFTFEQIIKINKYFLMCDSIEDIFCELSSNICNVNNISFSYNYLILTILLPCQKNKEAKFILNLNKNFVSDEKNNQLLLEYDKIIKNQKKNLKKKDSKIKSLKDKISNLENKILYLESIINSRKNKDLDSFNNNGENKINESIINIGENKEKVISEEERIEKLKKLMGRKCNLKLLYQMTKDGSSCSTFHSKVDNKGPTMTLFETEDGYKFGGYTSQSFQIGKKWIKDPDSFLFNFCNLNKFPIKNKNCNAIYFGSKDIYGPQFNNILVNRSGIKIGEIRVGNFIRKIEDLSKNGHVFRNNDDYIYKVEFI